MRYLPSDRLFRFFHTLTSASSIQALCPVSGVCSNPYQCQGYADTLASVRGMQAR